MRYDGKRTAGDVINRGSNWSLALIPPNLYYPFKLFAHKLITHETIKPVSKGFFVAVAVRFLSAHLLQL